LQRKVSIMQNIRALFLALAGITIFAALALFTVSLTLAVGGILTVCLAGRALSTRMKPAPIRTKADRGHEMRVWNDGRGTIIDL
jgi:hypothetical protein